MSLFYTLNDPQIYKGCVYPSSLFSSEALKNPYLNLLKEAFKDHWRIGHHESPGKDVLFARPEEILQYCIRHVHVHSGIYSPHFGPGGSRQSWDDWKSGRYWPGKKYKQIPTSDAYLIYAVNNRRDAALITFWADFSHDKSERREVMQEVIISAEKFYADTQSKPTPLDVDLWSVAMKNKHK